MESNLKNIALLGLGAMGTRMAQNLLDAGYALTVYNRTPERARDLVAAGAALAETPIEAAREADLVISMVADDDASRAVWQTPESGALYGLGTGALAIESSTLTPARVDELAAAVAERGARFLDAPVVGSRPQAEAGRLVYLVGGAEEDFAAARPILTTMGGTLHHVGSAGRGMWMKLVVNALFGIQVAALGELLGLLRGAEIDEAAAVDVLSSLPVLSPAAAGVADLMVRRVFTPMFPIDLVEKDLAYVVEAGRGADAELPTAEAVRKVYARASAQGLGGDNIAGVARLFGA